MITTVVRRASDGLLADIQSGPGLPSDTTPRINNAIAQFGGAAGDWQALEVPAELWTGINPLARQFATLNAGAISAISQSAPPQAVLSAATLEADGVTEITLTVNIPNYAGPVKFVLTPPAPAEPTTGMLSAVAGVATLTTDTDMLGKHTVIVETEAHGVAWASFEGVQG